MENIAIYRQSKIKQISTLNHLINELSKDNFVNKNNKNSLNVLYYHDFKTEKIEMIQYNRNGKNQNIIDKLKEYEDYIDNKARLDYKNYKEQEKDKIFLECKKAGTKPPKIRTVLQTKNLKKEFVIAIGGSKNIDNKQSFIDNAVKTVEKIMLKKGLTNENILNIAVHFDEKTPHIHCQYSDYSFKHKTTASELERARPGVDMSRDEKKAQYASICSKFGDYQDLVAENMKMKRGEPGSRAKHKNKAEYIATQQRLSEHLKNEINRLIQEQIKNETTIKEQEQKIKNNDIEIEEKKDKVFKNQSTAIRLDLGAYGFNKVINYLATKLNLPKNKLIDELSKIYNNDNTLSPMLNSAFSQLPKPRTIELEKQLTL